MNSASDSSIERIDAAVRCADCAAVCCRLTVVLLPGDSVPAWLTDSDERGLEIMAKGDDGWCVALDRHSMRCTIYERRPQICAEFAMGGVYCRDERDRWFGKSATSLPITVIS